MSPIKTPQKKIAGLDAAAVRLRTETSPGNRQDIYMEDMAKTQNTIKLKPK